MKTKTRSTAVAAFFLSLVLVLSGCGGQSGADEIAGHWERGYHERIVDISKDGTYSYRTSSSKYGDHEYTGTWEKVGDNDYVFTDRSSNMSSSGRLEDENTLEVYGDPGANGTLGNGTYSREN
ncbi:hypothetical protein [Bifidobacterium pseudolongum]|uniref:hypothetical protein n=1 Tax=Bifidobacterium pseudolongum TaxID=1694 RepID=UPI001020F279|nr:hypothetical protein [Bifidobacterium pseudolongum]